MTGEDSTTNLGPNTLRKCREEETPIVLAIINTAAEVYRGAIPADCWHEPYMSAAELDAEMRAGVEFWGYENAGMLVGVMGTQPVRDVDHAERADDRRLRRSCLRRGFLRGGKNWRNFFSGNFSFLSPVGLDPLFERRAFFQLRIGAGNRALRAKTLASFPAPQTARHSSRSFAHGPALPATPTPIVSCRNVFAALMAAGGRSR